MASPFSFLLASELPPRRVGTVVALLAVGLCTLIVYPLAHVAPVVSLSVVYLPAVLVVSVTWGAWLGVATAVVSAAAFNFFHLAPVGRFTLHSSENWVALAAFLVVAVLASSVAEVTRARTRDAEERRREADLAAEMARLLLRGNSLAEALPTAAARLAHTLELSSAAIAMDWQVRSYGGVSDALVRWCDARGLALRQFDWTPEHAAAGLRQGAFYLLRPDTYVALADDSGDPAVLERYFAARNLNFR